MPNSAEISTVGRTQATPTLYNNLVRDAVRLLSVTGSTLTIASGVITVSPSTGHSHYVVDTEASSAADDLTTISGGAEGDIIGIVSANSGRVVTLQSGAGNILLQSGSPVILDTVSAFLLRYNGSNWTPYGGGGSSDSATLTNKSGSSRAAGDVVVFDTTNDSAFTTTSYLQDIRVMGVVKSAIANNAAGPVYTGAGTVCTINCDSSEVAKGQFLISSATPGLATAGSYFREAGVFAIALTSKAGGSTGSVQAMIVDNFRQAIVGTSGWNFGGLNGSSGTTVSQKFSIATETWATIAGAALPGGRCLHNGMSYGTTGAYVTHGSSGSNATTGTASRYKMLYSSETFSTLTDGSIARSYFRSGINFSSKGFTSGGQSTASNPSNSNYKTTYATAAESVGNALSGNRDQQGGISDGTYVYIAGNQATSTDRIDNATETVTYTASATLGTAVAGYCFVGFPATAGYRSYNNGSGTVYSRKMPFSTATDANHSSSPSGNILYGSQVTDGVAVAYISGTAAANKISSSTGNYSSLSVYPAYVQGAAASYGAL
jgi:hypothetical protein